MSDRVLCVDVGTQSVRAGVFDLNGALQSRAERPIHIFNPQPDFYEQSSREIWDKAVSVMQECLQDVFTKDNVPAGTVVSGD